MSSDLHGQRSPLGLGLLQTAIMEVLWRADKPLMIREVRERIDYPPVSYSSVAVMTSILCGKGLAHRELTDRPGLPGPPVWKYRAARPASHYIGELIAVLLDRSPSPAETLAHALSTSRSAHQTGRTIHPSGHEHRHDV